MATPESISTPEKPAPPLVYRPLSGLAIASLFLAGCYAVVLVFVCGTAMYLGEAVPLGQWTLLFPAMAALMALTARRQIRRSEDTRSGMALANWAWWLSILFGLGYFAFYLATYLAVYNQAQRFARDWIDLIHNSKGDPVIMNRAFLLTQPPEQREGDSPADNKRLEIRYGQEGRMRGPLLGFRESELVRIIAQGGPEMSIQELGVGDWDYDRGGYVFRLMYRFGTPEGIFNVRLALRSSDLRANRQWFLIMNDQQSTVIGKPDLTPLGQALRKFRDESWQFVNIWLAKRAAGAGYEAYLDTLPFGERQRIENDYQCRLLVGDLAALAAGLTGGLDRWLGPIVIRYDGLARWSSYMTGYTNFANGSIVRADRLEAPEKRKELIRNDVPLLFGRLDQTLILKPGEFNLGRMEPLTTSSDVFRIWHQIAMDKFEVLGVPPKQQYMAKAEIQIESDPGPISAQRQPQWRVVSVNLLTGEDPPTEQQQQMMNLRRGMRNMPSR